MHAPYCRDYSQGFVSQIDLFSIVTILRLLSLAYLERRSDAVPTFTESGSGSLLTRIRILPIDIKLKTKNLKIFM